MHEIGFQVSFCRLLIVHNSVLSVRLGPFHDGGSFGIRDAMSFIVLHHQRSLAGDESGNPEPTHGAGFYLPSAFLKMAACVLSNLHVGCCQTSTGLCAKCRLTGRCHFGLGDL